MKKLLFILFLIPLLVNGQQYLNDNKFYIDGGRTTAYINGTYPTYDNRVMYLMTDTEMITNTTDELTLFSDTSAVGSRTIPANILREGDILKLTILCIYSSTGNPTNRMALYFGTDTLVDNSVTISTGHTLDYAEIQIYIKVMKSGSDYGLFAIGKTVLANGTSRTLITNSTGTMKVVDLSISNTLNFTYKFGVASTDNSLHVMGAILQILN